jgi:phthalate 4,5-dioxygenase oxygenase subunit
MVDAAIKMRDSNVALGRTQPHIPHASIASFEGVMPKTTDWRKINVNDNKPHMTAAE